MKLFWGICVGGLLSAAALATPANTAILDGRPVEYDTTDLRGTFQGTPAWGVNGTLSNLFVTWDATYLYVALQGWQQDNNKLVVLVDVDPGAGTGATTTTNWTGVEPSYIKYNDYGWVNGGDFGCDYLLASEGFFNNTIRILYDGVELPTTNNTVSLFDSGNGSTPLGTAVDMASHNDATACPHKGFEARIPWAVLYAGTRFGAVVPGETVPRGATLRLLAGIHNNNPNVAWSSPDTIPNQAFTNYVNGILTTATYLDVIVDGNHDGVPDMVGGDVNAPWIRAASGAVGGTLVYVAFNEPVTAATVQNTANWSVGGTAPVSAVAQGAYGVLLGLAAPIAGPGLLSIVATGVQDAAGNSRTTSHCLFPAEGGIPQAVAVTFLVFTNSGMGISPSNARPTAFFVNGSALPLEWGYPPVETTPLAAVPGTSGWVSATVTFPPGSPVSLYYKYSARISGTNNYEAIRLTDFANAARPLTLNTNGTPMAVVDYLGAAAHPLRNPGDTNLPSAHKRLYDDPNRADAGVRVRREILFQLDLSLRRRNHLQRVMVLGSDPLRGFNTTGGSEATASDYPDNSAYVNWDTAGIELFDDGTRGDLTAGDGIYSRLWAFTTNGFDSTLVPGAPHSLVGGGEFTEPYLGYGWKTRRSPRSLVYKYYVLTTASNHYESPSYNLEYYVADPTNTARIVLNPWVWDNEAIPPPPPTNAPVLLGVTVTGSTATIQFQNVLTEGSHGVRISTNLAAGFADYGHRATAGPTNAGLRQWSATIGQISPAAEYYSAHAGPEPDPLPTYWEPSFIPATATVWRLYYSQYKDDLKGRRTISAAGTFNGWGETPMTFLGKGRWAGDISLPAGSENVIEFKFRDGATWIGGSNLKAIRGGAGATWTPDQPTPGQLFTVTFNTAGTGLAGATNVNIHMGFDPFWGGTATRPMTNTSGSIWVYALTIPTNYSVSVNWVFNGYLPGSSTVTWYSPADWKAFFSTFVNPP